MFRYGVEQAIRDGFLVDYEPVTIQSQVRINGVFLKEGEQVGKIDTVTGDETLDEVEDERAFDATAVERDITAPDSNRKIIQEVAKYAFEHEQETGRFPKILIFAVNDLPHASHADQLVRVCREVFNQGDDFVQKITGNPNVDRPLQRIREFRNRPNPKVVVSVDMLTTGVDIPALEFIVFLRAVKSRILWEQMLGRGTRRCDEINKAKFTVFDCFDGTLFRYFQDASNFKIEEPRTDPLTIAQIIDNIWQNIDRQYHTNILVKRLRRIEKDMSGEARELFAKWIPEGDMSQFAGELAKHLRDKFADTMKLLRNSEFQDLLINYPRAKRVFWVGYEVQDAVTSRLEERYGQQPSAEDYLAAFSAFVQNKADEIEALRILISKPEGWNPDALLTLRGKLIENGYDEKTLRRAHERVHRKALADLISMVKHAAREAEPLLTAAERVAAALAEIRAFHTFTPEQSQWLDFIAQHLVENLCVDTADLDNQPVFTKHGGLARARRVFGDQLPRLIERLNYTLAA